MNGSSSTNATGPMAGMMPLQSQSDQSLLDTIQHFRPDKDHIDLNQLNETANKQGLLNEYQSRNAEMELDPKIARLRQLQQDDILNSYEGATKGELPVGMQNALVKAGLGAALANGTGTAAGTVGNHSAEQVFGSGLVNYLNQLRGLSGDLIANNPRPVVGLDPGSALSIRLQNNKDNQNLENAYRQQLIQGTAQAHSNLSNLASSLQQASAQEASSNAASKAAAGGRTASTVVGLVGAAAMAY